MNSTRPRFEDIHMEMARLVSQRSTCRRLHVGCVIASSDNRKILATGYNGNANGFPNDCDSDTPGACGCIHAEQNAVINCDSPRATPKIVFVTDLPCKTCTKFLINLGHVEKVYYARPYRLVEGAEMLKTAGIELIQYTEGVFDPSWLAELVAVFGWQGGTIHQALDEVKRLVRLERENRIGPV